MPLRGKDRHCESKTFHRVWILGKLRSVCRDFGGYILLTTSVVLWLMALTWGGDRYPWKSAQVLGTLISSIVGFTLFGLWEWRGKKDGLLHHDLFKNPNFAWCLVAYVHLARFFRMTNSRLPIFRIGIEGFVYLSYTCEGFLMSLGTCTRAHLTCFQPCTPA